MGSIAEPDPIDARLLAVQESLEIYRHARGDDPTPYDHAMQAIRNLQLAIEKPEEFVVRVRYQGHQVTAINMLNEMGVLEAIAAREGRKISAKDLARQTGCDELLIVRLLRLLAAVGCVDEAGPAIYRGNANTAELSKPGQIATFRYMAGMEWPCATHIRSYLASSDFHRDSDAAKTSAFEHTFGTSFWEYLSDPKHEEQKLNFDTQMSSGRRAAPQQLWFQRYPPVKKLSPSALRTDPEAVLFVDVGGGRGVQAGEFGKAYPHLPGRLICQDTPDTVAVHEGEMEGVEMMEYDFFTPQPVKGARYYLFRSICHDWTTAQCRELLSNTVAAMDPEYSSMLIDEWVLPEMNVSEKASCLDLSMMLNFNAMERTRNEWITLLDDVGLEVVGVFGRGEAGRTAESIVEARIKRPLRN